jgi:hypothetical protein
MHLVGQLSNPSSRLRTVLDAFPDGPHGRSRGPIVPQPAMRRLGNGVVKRAVVEVLATVDRSMTVADVRTAVEKLRGQSVSKDSINWCLSTGSQGSRPQFERVSRGCYRLVRPS